MSGPGFDPEPLEAQTAPMSQPERWIGYRTPSSEPQAKKTVMASTLVAADTNGSELDRSPSDGMLTECVSLAEKSRSKMVSPPSPSVIVTRPAPAPTATCSWRIRARPIPSAPVPVTRLDFMSERDMHQLLTMRRQLRRCPNGASRYRR